MNQRHLKYEVWFDGKHFSIDRLIGDCEAVNLVEIAAGGKVLHDYGALEYGEAFEALLGAAEYASPWLANDWIPGVSYCECDILVHREHFEWMGKVGVKCCGDAMLLARVGLVGKVLDAPLSAIGYGFCLGGFSAGRGSVACISSKRLKFDKDAREQLFERVSPLIRHDKMPDPSGHGWLDGVLLKAYCLGVDREFAIARIDRHCGNMEKRLFEYALDWCLNERNFYEKEETDEGN